ncbi:MULTISPECIES: hypothetical protein [unclassified Rathayibacter]|uniref:hypothetical protein n=1 Tax=unclassified Rathayibacter TaxID=2609250 RepID=UPI000CE9227D|nr:MULTISPECIES: hypothetical protein [unclassified Rathayibacter]PPI20521.1 hypothetical protein C5D08_10915 [Rathayibacter sp. AY1B6]PPI24094.1 hypothetical protein C5D44_12390 [Rathayibacter sp. AY1B5]PPI35252.1 hypothetical protein C5D34_07210 [Rathayibacter sp. AY1B1]
MSDPQIRTMPLRGDSARRWLHARHAETGPDPAFAVTGQEATAEGLLLRRIWHSAGSIEFRPSPRADSRSVVLLLPLEGAFTVVCREERAVVTRGTLAVLPARSGATITTSASGSRLVLVARPSGDVRPPSGLTVLSSPAAPVLVAAANALLDARLPVSGGLRTALEGLAAAVMAG